MPASRQKYSSPRSQRTSTERNSLEHDVLPFIDENENYELEPFNHNNIGAEAEDDLRPLASANHEGLPSLGSRRRSSAGSAQSYELYTPDEDKAVLWRLDRKLVGFMALLYCLSFLDRSNIGNARIAGMVEELNLSSNQYEWLLWAFYITYIAFEWMTLMYRLVPPHIYISLCILSWGIIASVQAVATSFQVLVVLRALLGISEAAFSPGVPVYLAGFFRRHELAFRTGLFISASPLSASFAGALAWAITKLGDHGPISAWRLLFLIEGFPSVLVAVWAWDFVPDAPGSTKWLTPRQREVAVLRLRQEMEYGAEEASEEKSFNRSGDDRSIKFREVWNALKDPKCYLIAFMFFSCNVAFSSMPVFLPTIIHDMGYHAITAQALTAPPYFFAFVVVLITAYYSDLHRSRSTYVMLHSVIATIGYATIAIAGYYRFENTAIRYFALYPATAGFFSAITIIITWNINNQETATGKGTGVAIMNLIGQLGPLVGTSIFPEQDGPWYARGMGICAGFMLLVGLLALVLRLVLARQNKKKREMMQSGEYAGIPLEEGGKSKERKVFEFML